MATTPGTAPRWKRSGTSTRPPSPRPGRECGPATCSARSEEALQPSGLKLLDRLNNIGHSLGQGTSYDLGYLDPWNETRLHGAWAIEPFVGNHLWGVKLEDVVWFGSERCTVIR